MNGDSRSVLQVCTWKHGNGSRYHTVAEFDELSDREREYYRTGPWSTREDYRKGQLVQPGPGRQGYQGESYTKDPDFIKWQKKNPPVGPAWLKFKKIKDYAQVARQR